MIAAKDPNEYSYFEFSHADWQWCFDDGDFGGCYLLFDDAFKALAMPKGISLDRFDENRENPMPTDTTPEDYTLQCVIWDNDSDTHFTIPIYAVYEQQFKGYTSGTYTEFPEDVEAWSLSDKVYGELFCDCARGRSIQQVCDLPSGWKWDGKCKDHMERRFFIWQIVWAPRPDLVLYSECVDDDSLEKHMRGLRKKEGYPPPLCEMWDW